MTVDMALSGGAPTYRDSGFIYGLSQNASAPALTLQSQIKAKELRAGGSQLGCPNGGWVNGAYTARWNFIKAYYARAKATGAKYEMILAAVRGSGGVCNVPSWPGDNGNWTPYATFVNQLIADAKANNVVPTIMSWHDLPGDPAVDAANLNAMLSARGMSVQGFDVNEYGAFGDEQQPGPSAWYVRPDVDAVTGTGGGQAAVPCLGLRLSGWGRSCRR